MNYKESVFIEDNKLVEDYRFEKINVVSSNYMEDGFYIRHTRTALVWVTLKDEELPCFIKELEQKALEDILKIPLVRRLGNAHIDKEYGDYDLNHIRVAGSSTDFQESWYIPQFLTNLSDSSAVCILRYDRNTGDLLYQLTDVGTFKTVVDDYYKVLSAELEEKASEYRVQQVVEHYQALSSSEQKDFLTLLVKTDKKV